MKAFKIIVAIVIALPLLFFGIGSVLPKTSHVERSIVINTPVGKVFFLVGDHREFQRWSPWSVLDPNMKVELSGPEIGVGSKMSWWGNSDVGEGTSTYTEYVPNSRAVVSLDFGEMGGGDAAWDLADNINSTEIIWSFDTTHKSIFERYFGLILDGILGKQYETGLAKLKELAESLPDIKTQDVTYNVGETELSGYLAFPIGLLDPVPGVVVVHEWWGHNDYARKRAEMLANQGYVALALDMYGDGKLAEHPSDATKFMQEVGANTVLTEARFDAAVNILKSHFASDGDNIAAVGYCFGGSVVINMARMGKNLKGVASFHGGLGNLSPLSDNVTSPMLVLNGESDPFVPTEHKEAFKKEMDEAKLTYEFVDYPGALHSFTNVGADAVGEKFELPLKYNAEADEDSWKRLEAFLQRVFY